MEGMVADLNRAKETGTSFENFLQENPTSNPEIELSVRLLSTASWPHYKTSDLVLPAEMVKSIDFFRDFYQTKSKKLTWMFSLGRCSINVMFGPEPIELIMTAYQASVLLLSNEAKILSCEDIKGQLNLTDEDIRRLLYSLSCAEHEMLSKDPSIKAIFPSDVFSINTAFSSKMRTIQVALPPMDERKKVFQETNREKQVFQETDREKQVFQETDRDKRYAIDASIIRIMKFHQVLPYQQLVLECTEQLRPNLKLEPKFIKRRMEDLVDREFLERDNQDHSIFRYLA